MSNRFIEKLSRHETFDAGDIAVLSAMTQRPRKYRARMDLIREGDPPGPVFVVLEGWACRYKLLPNGSRQIVAFLMPGDACDLHTTLLTEMDHSIQTLTPARVASVPRGEMQAAMLSHPAIARAMYRGQLIDEGTLRAWIVSMGRRTSEERVAHLVCELYLRSKAIGAANGNTLTLPFSQIVLADALGLTPVHVNRVLRKFRLAGLMTLSRGTLTILEPVRLIKVAGFDENYLHRRLHHLA